MVSKSASRAMVVLALLIATGNASAVNKCVDTNGRVTYQDRPCERSGKVIDAKPNSVDPTLDAGVRDRVSRGERDIAGYIKKEDTERAIANSKRAAYLRTCQEYHDEIERQSAWLRSFSPAVVRDAWARIDIANRKFRNANCGELRSYD